jgi:transcriptional regulator with XRE-family HTH domain
MKKLNIALLDARFDARLSAKQASELLGELSGDSVGRYERGDRIPTLERALMLEIIYQRPVAFLFPELYELLKARVRGARTSLRHCETHAGGRV